MTPPGALRARLSRLPLATLSLLILGLLIAGSPRLEAAFVLETRTVEDGELWRLLTGHLVHGTARLALFDLAALALFGAWIEGRSRRLLVLTVLASALAASLGILFWTAYDRYLGSSALSCGLLAAGAVAGLRAPRRPAERIAAVALAILLLLKLALESLGLWPGDLSGLPPEVEPAILAHVLGAFAGSGVCLALLAGGE